MIEALETRRLLSASIVDRLLTVDGTDGGDTILMSVTDGVLSIRENGAVTTFPVSQITSVWLRLGHGSDWLDLGNCEFRAAVFAGRGHDTVIGGAGDDYIAGGRGRDELRAGAGNDTISGGRASDQIAGDDGDDSLSGNQGFDTLDGGRGNDLLGGGRRRDVLRGGDGNDQMHGGHGSDVLAGRWGDDTLLGGTGKDNLQGGFDDDRLDGQEGADTLNGGAGSDLLSGDETDTIVRSAVDAETSDSYEGAPGTFIDGATVPAPFQRLSSADELRQWLIETAVRSYASTFGQGVRFDDVIVASGGLYTDEMDRTDYSQTNTQERGVDEADLVEIDGRYLYMCSADGLTILDARPAEETRIVAQAHVSGAALGMYLYGGRLTVLSQDYRYVTGTITDTAAPVVTPITAHATVRITVFDVSAPQSPVVLEQTDLDGSLVTSRAIGGRVYLVLQNSALLPTPAIMHYNDDITLYESEESYRTRLEGGLIDRMLPRYTATAQDGSTLSDELIAGADIYVREQDSLPCFTTVAVFNANTPGDGPSATATMAGWTLAAYASTNSLYLTTGDYSGSVSTTQILKFDLGADQVSLQAVGGVSGYVLNQFAMDEEGDSFRIATTDFGQSPRGNSVFVLRDIGDDLSLTGQVTGLAPTEQLYATRFIADKAYLVTAKRTDPLFVVDLSDPTHPYLAGELEIPGFSSYLHPIGENLLLGLGHDADPNTGRPLGLQLSLFDVSDPAHPTRVAVQELGEASASAASLAEPNHHAFGYFADQRIVAVPVLTWDGSNCTSRLELVHITDSGFEHIGAVQQPGCVERSVRIGTNLYSFSSEQIKVSRLNDPSRELASVWVGLVGYTEYPPGSGLI